MASALAEHPEPAFQHALHQFGARLFEAAPGLVGTLEDCQQTVAALYAAGMRELRLHLPGTPDIPDVIAQMSTLRGDVLSGLDARSPRSPAPAAPTDWGGRP